MGKLPEHDKHIFHDLKEERVKVVALLKELKRDKGGGMFSGWF